ncbi:DNA/RNA non-specific endonuclease [Streptomyces sp. NPDC057094]|uniref:DNA/RNA non-specific endonuclease n=1 Tax=Streptomyces sp. NPDC057094 TaxID=3346018 RepID=UPI00363CCA1E
MGAMSVACIKTVNDIVTQPTAPRARDVMARVMRPAMPPPDPRLESPSAVLECGAAALSAMERAASVRELLAPLSDLVDMFTAADEETTPEVVLNTLKREIERLRVIEKRRTVELSQARIKAGQPLPKPHTLAGNETGTDAIRASLPVPIAADLVITATQTLSLDNKLKPSALEPNTAYTYGEQVYVTDGRSRPAYIRGVLTHIEGKAPRHKWIQRGVGHAGRAAEPAKFGNLIGGHPISVAVGGFPSGPNLFPQNADMNLSAFSTLETELRELAAQGVHVEFEIRLAVDNPEDEVPSALLVTYYIEGEEYDQITLLNEAHQLK